MLDYNQNKEGDYQNFQNYQDNQNNQNYPIDQYSSKPQQNPPQDNGNYYSNPQLLNSQTPSSNNSINDTSPTPDDYQPISDQVAPLISNPDVAMDQQMAQPSAQPIYEPILPQDNPVQPVAFDNAPLEIQPPIQPRRAPTCRTISIIGFIASIISSIIIIIRFVNRNK